MPREDETMPGDSGEEEAINDENTAVGLNFLPIASANASIHVMEEEAEEEGATGEAEEEATGEDEAEDATGEEEEEEARFTDTDQSSDSSDASDAASDASGTSGSSGVSDDEGSEHGSEEQDEDDDEPGPAADGEDQAGERLRGEQVHHQSLGAGDSDDDDPDYQNMSDVDDMSNEESGLMRRDPHFM